eukprot:GILI01015291.1.p1 GENE.GILI01015291.1~~GILI01015291.1.p1  ORF type:complete len:222 (+),score=31.50 GILI01015291.1:59-724(+)
MGTNMSHAIAAPAPAIPRPPAVPADVPDAPRPYSTLLYNFVRPYRPQPPFLTSWASFAHPPQSIISVGLCPSLWDLGQVIPYYGYPDVGFEDLNLLRDMVDEETDPIDPEMRFVCYRLVMDENEREEDRPSPPSSFRFLGYDVTAYELHQSFLSFGSILNEHASPLLRRDTMLFDSVSDALRAVREMPAVQDVDRLCYVFAVWVQDPPKDQETSGEEEEEE